ncbi:MAG: sigma-70 family RNA polymerase sigma factor [Chitinivibrionales bacterium]|nr:sigma-70 family RNA polymerase sigma factor [Chitinivibrionales bacterium]
MRVEDGLWHETAEQTRERHARSDRVNELTAKIEPLLAELTDQQATVVRLYFFEGLNQRQIAERLGITQQSVSEHLYGKTRGGKSVGGALRKLRKACGQRGIEFGF